MLYTLMHKNVPVIHIELDKITGIITGIGDVLNRQHIPVGIQISKGAVDRASLNTWWFERSIPTSRSGIRKALEVLDVSSAQALLTECFGLSLSDQYWVCPADLNLEQIQLVDSFDWLDLSALYGISEEFSEIISASPMIDTQRRDVLCRALDKRLEQLKAVLDYE